MNSEKTLAILGKYKVIGDTTFGLGHKEAEKLVEALNQHYKALFLEILKDELIINSTPGRAERIAFKRNELRKQLREEVGKQL